MTDPIISPEAPLNPSGASGEIDASVQSAPEAANPELRINNLMSLYNKEQAEKKRISDEADRLREQLATAVAGRVELSAQLEALRQQAEAAVPEHQQALTDLQQTVARLETDRISLAMANAQFRFLRNNPDLMGYADVLPLTDDPSMPESAVATIRTGRDAETARMRGQLTNIQSMTAFTSMAFISQPIRVRFSSVQIAESLRTQSSNTQPPHAILLAIQQ